MRPPNPGCALWCAAMACALSVADRAGAFPHVVQKGETLAQISEKIYGSVEFEKVLVAANDLDVGGGLAIVPGLRLEVPAITHRRVLAGDTWSTLATALLGDPERSDVLSIANDSSPWLTPAEGAEIVVPYNLRVVVGQTDTLVTLASRFLAKREQAWILDRYNHLKGDPPHRDDLILVPLTDLHLTPEGKTEAAQAETSEHSAAAGVMREAQKKAEMELPALLGDVRSGRYVDAVTRATKILSYGELTRAQLATLHRQLLEAYVALDAPGLAAASCRMWRELDPRANLDPVYLSPKIMTACENAMRSR